MQIYPAIDIKDGKCVRLSQGVFDSVTIFHEDVSDAAKAFREAGATYIHVVDLDGARHGAAHNTAAIEKIISAARVPVQMGGGIRTLKDIEQKLEMGVSRVILGTAALKNPELIKEAIAAYGDSIAVGVDAGSGYVAVEGWEEVSRIKAFDLCMEMKSMGVKTIIYTDIAKDGMMSGPNMEATKEIIGGTGLQIIASGGVSSMEDIDGVKRIGASGVIIGKALYLGALNLKEVIEKFQEV